MTDRPDLPPETCLLHWRDESDCAALASRLAAAPELGAAAIELRGTLGAGKTSFVRHLLRALGVEGRVKSPSYALMESYSLPAFNASHFDFYRFDDPQEWHDAGFRDVFAADGLKLVEWPEKAEALLPKPDLRIEIVPIGETARRVSLTACTPRGQSLLEAVRGGSAGSYAPGASGVGGAAS